MEKGNQVDNFTSGFVSILGRPNVGKSTLLNRLLGRKVSIVSPRPQTTRTTLQGVLTLSHAQIVFMDTPGIHESDTLINRRMMNQVHAALEGKDVLLFMVDSAAPFGTKDENALRLVRRVRTPALLLANKIDLVKDKRHLLPLIEKYHEAGDFAEYIPVSAATGEGLDRLQEAIVSRLPKGPCYFPDDFVTDQPERFFAAEVIREKILRETREEVPHAVMVQIDQWEEGPHLLRVAASIQVERHGQKVILIGSGGTMLKRIGTLARQELEFVFGRKMFLELFVKVRPKWREKPAYVNSIDWKA